MKHNFGLYPALDQIARTLKPKSYLEIGTREGDSLVAVIRAAGPQLELVVCCDTWGTTHGGSGRGSPDHIERRLVGIGYQGRRYLLTGDSKKTVPTLHSWEVWNQKTLNGMKFVGEEEVFDLILVDGDHTKAGAWADLENAWPLLRVGGILVFDDLIHELYPHMDATFLDFACQAGAEVILHETRIYSGVGAIRKTAESKYIHTKPREYQMKRAYLVCGLPSSGNKLMTRLLIGAGCFGDAGPQQRLDAGYPSLPGQEMIVLLRSVPHGLALPDLRAEVRKMQFAQYAVTVVWMVRDWNAMAQSQKAAGHAGADREDYNAEAIRHVCEFVSELPMTVPVMQVSYDALVCRPVEYGAWVMKNLGFHDVTDVDFMQIEDRNAKYYGLEDQNFKEESDASTITEEEHQQ